MDLGGIPVACAALIDHEGRHLARHPRNAAIGASHPVLEHDRAARADPCIDPAPHQRLILCRDVIHDPGTAGRHRIGSACAGGQLVHLVPVGAHAVMHLGTCRRQRGQPRLTRAQGQLAAMALDVVGSRPCEQFEQSEFVLRRPIRHRELGPEQSQQATGTIEQRSELGGTDAAAQRRLVIGRSLQRGEGFDVLDHQLPTFAPHGVAGRLEAVLQELLDECAAFVMSAIDTQLHLAVVCTDQLHAAAVGTREGTGKRGDLLQRDARIGLCRQADLQGMQATHAGKLVPQRRVVLHGVVGHGTHRVRLLPARIVIDHSYRVSAHSGQSMAKSLSVACSTLPSVVGCLVYG